MSNFHPLEKLWVATQHQVGGNCNRQRLNQVNFVRPPSRYYDLCLVILKTIKTFSIFAAQTAIFVCHCILIKNIKNDNNYKWCSNGYSCVYILYLCWERCLCTWNVWRGDTLTYMYIVWYYTTNPFSTIANLRYFETLSINFLLDTCLQGV